MGNKAKKGTVSIDYPRNDGKARLRFRYNGSRESITCEVGGEKLLAARIILDIQKGCYNRDKYKIDHSPLEESSQDDLKGLYTKWVTEYRNGNLKTNSNYSQVYSLFTDSGTLPSLKDSSWSYTTYNRRLHTLNLFAIWLIKIGHIDHNPYEDIIPRKKDNTVPKTNRKPLSVQQINTFLDAIRTNKFRHKRSGFDYSFYYPFFYIIFKTGMRNEEIIGLRVKHIDFDNNIINVVEVLARGRLTNQKHRIRKSTKNNKERAIPIDEDIKNVLLVQIQGKSPEDLVFTTPVGNPIDDRKLQYRIFKPYMRKLGFGEKDLYCARHSFASRAIHQGMPISDVASLVGNKVETLVRHYVEAIETPKELPKM